jgi:DNA polymerase-3 subunit alpha/error-prone DNA polymerase
MPPQEGDLLRRDLKKKKKDFPLKQRFLKEAEARGYKPEDIRKLWKTMEKFSSYSFNKAHSASYAHMAYQAVYLKVHHPLHYLTAVLNAGGGYYGLEEYIEEAKRNKIPVVGPDINRSEEGFKVEGQNIRVGLTAIKGLGVRTAGKIIEERSQGEYLSPGDFLGRVTVTKPELFSLIKAGAFDSLEPRRTKQILRYFRGIEGVEDVSDLDAGQKAQMLVEVLGFDPAGDSLTLFGNRRPGLRIKDLPAYVGKEVELLVRIVDARLKRITKGQRYFFLFEDETGILEGVGETRCLAFGTPPACYLRGQVRRDGNGRPKIFNCMFISGESF